MSFQLIQQWLNEEVPVKGGLKHPTTFHSIGPEALIKAS